MSKQKAQKAQTEWKGKSLDQLFAGVDDQPDDPPVRTGLTAREEREIRGWLAYIHEDDEREIEGVIAQARQAPEARDFYLSFARGEAFTYRPDVGDCRRYRHGIDDATDPGKN